MRYQIQVVLVSSAIVVTSVVIAACGGGAAPTALPATAVPATNVVSNTATSAPSTTAPSTDVPATSAPTVAVSTSTVAPAATNTQAASPTSAPTQASAPSPTTGSASTDNWVDPTPGQFTKEDVDHIFPPGRGQDLVFQNCTNCHNWVPLVFARFDKAGWEQNRSNHENRVTAMSQADKDFLYNYLITNFPPDKEPPDNIPQELLDQWTSY